MPAGGQGEFVVGKPGGPVSAEHSYRQVFVDDDHLAASAGSVLGIRLSASEQRISRAHRVEGSLELILKVSGGQAAQELPVCVSKSRIARRAPPAALLQQLLTGDQPIILSPRRPFGAPQERGAGIVIVDEQARPLATPQRDAAVRSPHASLTGGNR